MFNTAVVIDVDSTVLFKALGVTSVLHDLGRRFGVVQAAHLMCTSPKQLGFFWDSTKKSRPDAPQQRRGGIIRRSSRCAPAYIFMEKFVLKIAQSALQEYLPNCSVTSQSSQ